MPGHFSLGVGTGRKLRRGGLQTADCSRPRSRNFASSAKNERYTGHMSTPSIGGVPEVVAYYLLVS